MACNGEFFLQKHTGIILRQLDSPYKIAVLDQLVGRFDGIVTCSIPIGALCGYTVEKKHGTLFYITHVNIQAVPLDVAREDILFWHHILELCYYFVPQGCFTYQLFELLQFLYTIENGMCWCMRSKKIYMFKLFFLIGLYKKLPELPILQIQHLQALPLNMIASEVIDGRTEKILDQWLRVCVYEHPAIKKFNTVQFLLSK